MARTLMVEIVGDSRSLNRAIRSTETTTKGFSKTIGNLGKVAGAAAGAAGIGALIYTVKTGIGEFAQSQKVMAQTNAVIKSTGKVANVTADDVSKLATSIMKKTGIDDEQIASSENMLLTFKDIRNEVGKGNDIFNQATQTVTDMSVAFGTDANKSAIQLGKALNDPVKGITALSKIGVTFTEGQKKTIKSLVESGDKLKAQKLILAELKSEVGGSAEAYGKTLPGQINIAKEAFNNFAGDLVAKSIPVISDLIDKFRVDVLPVIRQTIQVVRDNWPVVGATIKQTWEKSIKPSLDDMIKTSRSLIKQIRDNWPTLGPIVEGVGTIVQAQVRAMTAVLRALAALLRGDWSEAWQQYKNAVGGAVKFFQAQVAVVAKIANALGDALWHGLVAAIQAGYKMVKNAITGLFDKVIGWAKDALGIGSPSKVFHEIGRDTIRGFANGVGSAAGMLKTAVLNVVKSLPSKALGAIGGLFGGGAQGVTAGKGGSTLGTLIPWANSEGMQITSTTGGTHVKGSYHYQGRAIDVAGSAASMRRFFFDSLEHFGTGIKELFYDPVGEYVKNGSIIRGAIGGHSDHVHLALGEGGIVTRPTRALIGEKGPEAVIPLSRGGGKPMQVNLNVDGRTLAAILIDPLRSQAQIVQQRTGRPAFA